MLELGGTVIPALVAAQLGPTPIDSIVVTRHEVTVAGRALRYAARAGLLPIRETESDAEDAPLFIAGESFGTTRGANVADVLARRRIPLRGVVLAALAIPLGERSADLRAALALPTYTLAAFYWKKLPPDLQSNRQRAL